MRNATLHPGGISMPIIGLGTFKIQGRDVVHKCIESALSAGYRSFDTASVYRNEAHIGDSLKILLPKFGLTRSDIFITSKLGPKDHGSGSCKESCLRSLTNLQCEYLDLYLIHWPGTQGMKPEDSRHPQLRLQSWRDLEDLHEEGKIKAIGVSNYTKSHLAELVSQCRKKPAVLQIEYHPHLGQKELLDFCVSQKIHFQAYSSLGTSSENKLLEEDVVREIAAKYNKSSAQILLRWAVQQNVGVLPKSTNAAHMAENIDIFDFDISTADMARLSSLDKSHHYCWNPDKVT